MKLGYKIKPRDAKSNPTTAILAAVFAMFLISGLLLLLLALLLYKMEPGESVIKIGIVAVYVISGLCGGFSHVTLSPAMMETAQTSEHIHRTCFVE